MSAKGSLCLLLTYEPDADSKTYRRQNGHDGKGVHGVPKT